MNGYLSGEHLHGVSAGIEVHSHRREIVTDTALRRECRVEICRGRYSRRPEWCRELRGGGKQAAKRNHDNDGHRDAHAIETKCRENGAAGCAQPTEGGNPRRCLAPESVRCCGASREVRVHGDGYRERVSDLWCDGGAAMAVKVQRHVDSTK